MQVIDTRGASGFEKGNIGGSVNIPYTEFKDEKTNGLLSKDERSKVLEKHGIDVNKDIVVTCQAGITSSVGFVAITDLK